MLFEYKKNRLQFMGHDLQRITMRTGTPVYIYSKERILQKLVALRQAFSQPIGIHYAMKACFFPPVLKTLRNAGAGVDVVSGGEIQRALECGFTGSQIIFSGVGKTSEEIELALKNRIMTLNVESPQELDRIGRLARKMKRKASVSFRLNPDVNPRTHPYITTGFKQNKFGMDKSFLPELLRLLKRHPRHLELVGLDFHIGSQLLHVKPFEDALVKSVPIYKNLQSLGFALKYFDLGGGLGISYAGEKTIPLTSFAEKMEKHLRPLGCQILCEPGRYLTGDAGVLVTHVEYVKKTPFKNFFIVDAGMHHLIRPALYGSYHEILPVFKRHRKKIQADVVGPICESSDFLAKDRRMEEPQQGDLLAVCDAGAYGSVMASDYNLHRKPAEVMI